MGQATFSVRMDENLENDFDSLCEDFGMSMTTAINVFVPIQGGKLIFMRPIPFYPSILKITFFRILS